MNLINSEALKSMQEKSKRRYGLNSKYMMQESFLQAVRRVAPPIPSIDNLPWRKIKKPETVKRIKNAHKRLEDMQLRNPPKEIKNIRDVVPDKPKDPIVRPLAVYSNIPSPYGISDKLRNKCNL